MKVNSIRLRLTVGVLLIFIPFLFALSHLILFVMHAPHGPHGPGNSPESLNDTRRLLLTLSYLATGAFGVGAWLVVGRTLSPIRRLTQEARNSGLGGEPVQLNASSHDPEIIELVATFNALAQRIQESAESKGRFYAAASHELRTPLQALLGHLELAAARPRSAEESEATIAEVLEQTKRLIGLVEGILLLHRIDAERGAERESYDLSVVLDECLSDSKGATLTGADAPISVLAYPSHLEILFVNMISNAVRHGAPGQGFSVVVEQEDGGATVRISNPLASGSKLDIADLDEPFAGVKKSRASGASGNGLGLAICRAICQANAWKLALMLDEGRFVAIVRFL